jgi:GTP-binding protein
MLRLAIVGRPNVGKSTLFNRLVGEKLALVHEAPGLTRDWREGRGRLGDLEFVLIDTAGFEEGGRLSARMRAQTASAVGAADACLFLIDARAGVTPMDGQFAAWLRRLGKPVILVANKADGRRAELWDAFRLGFGEPIAISAEHGEGLADLYAALARFGPGEALAAPPVAEIPIAVAIVGRPNVGKSTLANRLLGEERLLTGPEPGITRDAIRLAWCYRGRAYQLIDTAGLRRRARVTERVETLAMADAVRAIAEAHVVIVVIDASQGLDRQDLAIADKALAGGKAVLFAANKWDLVTERKAVRRFIEQRITTGLAEGQGLPVLPMSASRGLGLDRLMRAVSELHARWQRRLPTAALNRWLEEATSRHPPPAGKGLRVRLRYIAQISAGPPTFVMFANRPAGLAPSYLRYLGNSLRQAFDLDGVPVRFKLRRGKNPFI